jgi:hypothetical protein
LLRLAAAVTVLWFLWRHVGAAPFNDGLRAVTWPAVLAAITLTALTTVCSAWRWRVAAQALGIGIGLPAAVRSYYRSLLLSSVLIGGVLGDVHRAVTHGRRSGDVVLGLDDGIKCQESPGFGIRAARTPASSPGPCTVPRSPEMPPAPRRGSGPRPRTHPH